MTESIDSVNAKFSGKSFQLTGQAVYIVSILAVVGAFLVYLERRDRTETDAIERVERAHAKIADQRIDQCHSIQVHSVEALERSSESAVILAESLGGFSSTLDRIEEHSIKNTQTLLQILHQTRK